MASNVDPKKASSIYEFTATDIDGNDASDDNISILYFYCMFFRLVWRNTKDMCVLL